MSHLMIDQIAVTVTSDRGAYSAMEKIGGEWTEDNVEFRELGDGTFGQYHLFFNYDLGIEFEILVWKTGPFWLKRKGVMFSTLGVSHYGIHVDNAIQEAEDAANKYGVDVVQAVETISHSNPFLVAEGRRYLYAIVDTRDLLGADLKFIERVV